MPTESTDRLVVALTLCSFLLVITPGLRNTIDMTCYGGHHRCLGPVVDLTWTLAAMMLS